MAYIAQRANGKWRAQVLRRKIRRTASFATREEAEAWSERVERQIQNLNGVEPIELTPREVLDLYNRSKERARVREIDHTMTRAEMVDLFNQTRGRCSVSGIMFNRFRPMNSTKRPWYPSIDRIDSTKGYSADNCRFVCVAVNVALGEWGDWVLKAIARSMLLQEEAPCEGQEAPPYSFKPIGDGFRNYRQRVRMRIRDRARGINTEITNRLLTEKYQYPDLFEEIDSIRVASSAPEPS